MRISLRRVCFVTILASVLSVQASAQSALDRVSPPKVAPPELPRLDKKGAATITTTRAPARPSAQGRSVYVGAINLAGLDELHAVQFSDIVEAYFGRTLPTDQLTALTDRIAERARSLGYVLATARIDPQPMVAGVLTVRVDEGRIDDVRIVGNDNSAVRAALMPLTNGRPITLSALERRLLIAGDIDGITVSKSRLSIEGNRVVLVVNVATDRVTGYVGFNNDATRPVGPEQIYGSVAVNGIAAADDSLTLTVLDTAFQPSEVYYAQVRYAKRVTSQGTELALSGYYSATHPAAYLKDYDLSGESWSGSVSLLQPVIRRRKTSLWLTASIDVRDVRQRRGDRLIRKDRLTVARLGFYGFEPLLGGTLRISSTLNQGLDMVGATDRADPLASRFDADGTFTSFVGYAAWTKPVATRLSANLAVFSQLSSQPLLVTEEFGLGGSQFLRAYDYSERSGDNGYAVSGEVRYNLKGKVGPARSTQLYAFVDGGEVENLRDNFGSGSLVSTGGGVRLGLPGALNADLQVAVPLSGDRYDSGDSTPRLRFSMLRSF